MRRVHLLISGKVQGVWYRESAKDEAKRLAVRGWVRNLVDGRVEAVAEGPPQRIDAFVAWCRHGPKSAQVEAVEVGEEPAKGDFLDFRVLR